MLLGAKTSRPSGAAAGGRTSRVLRTPERIMASGTATTFTSAPAAAQQTYHYAQIEVETQPGISIFNITPQIKDQIQKLGVQEGFVNVLSRHTTTAIAINEYEIRLLDDIRQVGTMREKP